MTLTAKQQKAIARAPEKQRRAMAAAFAAQRANKPGPVARPKKQPRQRARPMRAHGVMDPMHPAPVPSLQSAGNALPHTSLVSTDFTVGTTNSTVLVVGNVGNAATVGCLFEVQPNGDVLAAQLLHIPTVAAADAAGGPSAGRAMKCSVSVVNCSNALKRGGRVTYINSSQRLPAPTGSGPTGNWGFGGIIGGIKSSPYRRRIMGDTLAKPLQLVTYPADSSTYERYSPWRGSLTANEFMAHTLGASAVNPISDAVAVHQRPMSVVAYVFDPAADQQDYSVTIRASYYARWPLTSVPGQSMKPTPTAPPGLINNIVDEAEALAHDLVPVGEGAAAATYGPRVAGALGSAARSAFNMLRAGGGAIAGAAEGIALEAGPMLPLLL